MPYVSADGYFWPCCWVPNHPRTDDIKKHMGALYTEFDVSKHSLEDIASSSAMKLLESSWEDGSFAPCMHFCGRPFDENTRMTNDDITQISLTGSNK
jgi:hypothetical protein